MAAKQTDTKFERTRGNGHIIVGPCILKEETARSDFFLQPGMGLITA
jgi:hypothetical protein